MIACSVYTSDEATVAAIHIDHPVYTLQANEAIVAAISTCLIEQPTDDRHGDSRLQCIHWAIVAVTITPTGRFDVRPVYTSIKLEAQLDSQWT